MLIAKGSEITYNARRRKQKHYFGIYTTSAKTYIQLFFARCKNLQPNIIVLVANAPPSLWMANAILFVPVIFQLNSKIDELFLRRLVAIYSYSFTAMILFAYGYAQCYRISYPTVIIPDSSARGTKSFIVTSK